MRSIDERLSRALHGLKPGWLDYALLPPGVLFGSYGLPFVILAVGLLNWRLALVCTLAAITTLAFTGPLKHYIGRPRPLPAPAGRAFGLRALVDNPSFPSGDSAQAAAFAMLLVLHGPFEDWRRWLFLLLAPLCMFSRIYYGAHWIGDTLAGAAIGAAVGALYAGWFGAWLA